MSGGERRLSLHFVRRLAEDSNDNGKRPRAEDGSTSSSAPNRNDAGTQTEPEPEEPEEPEETGEPEELELYVHGFSDGFEDVMTSHHNPSHHHHHAIMP